MASDKHKSSEKRRLQNREAQRNRRRLIRDRLAHYEQLIGAIDTSSVTSTDDANNQSITTSHGRRASKSSRGEAPARSSFPTSALSFKKVRPSTDSQVQVSTFEPNLDTFNMTQSMSPQDPYGLDTTYSSSSRDSRTTGKSPSEHHSNCSMSAPAQDTNMVWDYNGFERLEIPLDPIGKEFEFSGDEQATKYGSGLFDNATIEGDGLHAGHSHDGTHAKILDFDKASTSNIFSTMVRPDSSHHYMETETLHPRCDGESCYNDFVGDNEAPKGGRTPLHHAAMNRNTAMVSLLLKSGANLVTQDEEGNTPLHHAARLGDEDIVAILCRNGSQINDEDLRSQKQQGQWIDIRNSDGFTALHLAVLGGQAQVARLLLETGADVNLEMPVHSRQSAINS